MHVWSGFWFVARFVGLLGLLDQFPRLREWLKMIPDALGWFCLGVGFAFTGLWIAETYGTRILKVVRRRFWSITGKPNYTAWRTAEYLTPGDGAYLWADRAPTPANLQREDVQFWLSILLGRAKPGFFVPHSPPWSGDPKERIKLGAMTKEVVSICKLKSIPLPTFFADVWEYPPGVVATETVIRRINVSPYADASETAHLTKTADDG